MYQEKSSLDKRLAKGEKCENCARTQKTKPPLLEFTCRWQHRKEGEFHADIKALSSSATGIPRHSHKRAVLQNMPYQQTYCSVSVKQRYRSVWRHRKKDTALHNQNHRRHKISWTSRFISRALSCVLQSFTKLSMHTECGMAAWDGKTLSDHSFSLSGSVIGSRYLRNYRILQKHCTSLVFESVAPSVRDTRKVSRTQRNIAQIYDELWLQKYSCKVQEAFANHWQLDGK